MKIRHYTLFIIQIVVFAALIGMFYYHNRVRYDVITERIDKVSDSIYMTTKTYPGHLFLLNAERQKDRKGNYWLSEQDFAVLEGALKYHNKKVETACSEVRNEVANDMTRLNTWISLWMGILAVLGVFVPIAINIASIRGIEKEIENQNNLLRTIKDDANHAETKAHEAKMAAEKSEDKVGQVNVTTSRLNQRTEDLAHTVDDYQNKFFELQENVNDASQKAKGALENVIAIKLDIDLAKISIRLVYILGALKDIENSYRIAQLLNVNKSDIIEHHIDKAILAFKDLEKYNNEFSINPERDYLIISIMHDFVLSFQKIQTFFSKRKQLEAIEEINNAITAFLGLTLQPNDDRSDALRKIIVALNRFKENL